MRAQVRLQLNTACGSTERIIRLAGFEPGEEIEIAVTGTRPGERLNEILFAKEEPRVLPYGIDGVMAAKQVFADRAVLEGWIVRLREAVARGDRAAAEAVFEEAVPNFRERGGRWRLRRTQRRLQIRKRFRIWFNRLAREPVYRISSGRNLALHRA